MTAPNNDQGPQGSDGGGSGGKGKGASAPAPIAAGDVVRFTHRDPILGRPHRGVGVVAAVDDQGVTVAPLAQHRVRVALADVTPLSAGDDPAS